MSCDLAPQQARAAHEHTWPLMRCAACGRRCEGRFRGHRHPVASVKDCRGEEQRMNETPDRTSTEETLAGIDLFSGL